MSRKQGANGPATTAGRVIVGGRTNGSPAAATRAIYAATCAGLGKEELEYRSAVRNLERCVTWDGFIRRKHRKQFDQLLEHGNSRVRALAREIQQADLVARQTQREMREEDEAALEWRDAWIEDEMEEFAVPEELPPEFGEPGRGGGP